MQNSTAFPMIISESMAISDVTLRPLIKNFQEVTTLNDSIWNVLAFSFDFFPTDSNSIITDTDIIQLQGATTSNSSRLYTRNITYNKLDKTPHQGNQTTDGAVRYHFTVDAGELEEGTLQLQLSVKLQCLRYNNYYCSQSPYRYGCTCTQWQHERESEAIQVNGKQGMSIVATCMQDA